MFKETTSGITLKTFALKKYVFIFALDSLFQVPW